MQIFLHNDNSLLLKRMHIIISASNRNDYQEYFLRGKGGWCVGLTTVPHSCADCLEMWELHLPGTLKFCQACLGIALPLPFTLARRVREEVTEVWRKLHDAELSSLNSSLGVIRAMTRAGIVACKRKKRTVYKIGQ